MTSKQKTLDGSEDPWKNKNTLKGLYHGDELSQAEIAEFFNNRGHEVAPTTISYWMNKLEINTTHTSHNEPEIEEGERECLYHDGCGNMVHGGRNTVCVDCVLLSRERSRNGHTPIEFEEEVLNNEYTTMKQHMINLNEYHNE